MNRRYSAEEYMEKCDLLRKYFHNPALTTDVIVGFPQETEEEFAQTIEFLKRIHFYEMHVFKYSRRAGTRAADMPGQLTENQKGQRSDVLLKLDQEMSLEYRRSFLGEEYVKAAIPWEEGKKGAMITGTMASMLNDEVFLLG